MQYLRVIRKLQYGFPRWASMIDRMVLSRWLAPLYVILGCSVLLSSTLLWAILGAQLQNSNADELVEAYLFQTPGAVSGALIPAAHSFFVKWPLFLAIHLFGSIQTGLIVLTVLPVVLTVAVFGWFLAWYERRPLYLATLLLLFASALLLVPAVPAAGNLLPVNMAMLATRNLEYVLYMAAVWLMVRNSSFRKWQFWVSAGVLAILVASDNLFIVLGLGGALASICIFFVSRRWRLMKSATTYLVGAILGTVAGLGLLAMLTFMRVTHIIHGNGASPYSLSVSLHNLAIASTYGVIGIAVNVGADPAAGTTVLAAMSRTAVDHLRGWSGLALLVNLVVFIIGCWHVWQLVTMSLRRCDRANDYFDTPEGRVAGVLVGSAVTAFLAFVLSKHYYAGDARYLTIWLFVLFVALAAFVARHTWSPRRILAVGLVALAGMGLAVPAVLGRYRQDQTALMTFNRRNELTARVLANHGYTVLVGDYWRVVPIKLNARKPLTIVPLDNCTQPRPALTRIDWSHDASQGGFAYLLSLDKGLTDYPQCSLATVTNAFGGPTSVTVIAGTTQQPLEELLFYGQKSR